MKEHTRCMGRIMQFIARVVGARFTVCPLGIAPALPPERIYMNKKERVDAAVRGDKVDHVPVSMWQHDYAREWDIQSLMEAMVENFTENDWDFMKVNPRVTYFA